MTCESVLIGIERSALGEGPAFQGAVQAQSEIVVQVDQIRRTGQLQRIE